MSKNKIWVRNITEKFENKKCVKNVTKKMSGKNVEAEKMWRKKMWV